MDENKKYPGLAKKKDGKKMIIHVRSSANFREIRMGGIGPGILYRASHPMGDDQEDTDITKLAVRARIATILNLTDTEEEIKQKAVLAPWYRNILNAGGVMALGMNFDGMSRQFCIKLGKGIRFMLSRPAPYLIHCYAGADRTGFVAIVLEALMGAAIGEIIDDYLKSFFDAELLTARDSPQYRLNSAVVHEILTKINNGEMVTEENLREAAERYFVTKAALTAPELDLLKERLAGK
jgi:hypothetical protein